MAVDNITVVVAGTGDKIEGLGIRGGVEDGPAELDRDDLVLLAVNDEDIRIASIGERKGTANNQDVKKVERVSSLGDDCKPAELGGAVEREVPPIERKDAANAFTLGHAHQCRVGQVHRKAPILAHEVSHSDIIRRFE